MKTKHAPYSLYRKRNKSGAYVWYVRYWDADERRYSAVRSTGVVAAGKKGRRPAADEAARAMLDGIRPASDGRGLLDYVSAYWDAGHPHFQEREKLQNKKVSAQYLRKSREIMRLYIEPYEPFRRMRLRDLSGGAVRRWMLYLADRGLSACRIDSCVQALRAPVCYAVREGDVDGNPFQNVRAPARVRVEKGCLSRDETRRLADAPYDPLKKLAALFGVLCGLRLGEVRGLRREDISGGWIYVRHNWQNGEGLKGPKCGSNRTVPVPPDIEALLEGMPEREGYVFPGKREGVPVCMSSVQEWFYGLLEVIGISGEERKERRITFHSGRHTFVTLGRQAGISDIDIQALAGHKSGTMMEHYSHGGQVINLGSAALKMAAYIGRPCEEL
jgi:integrase